MTHRTGWLVALGVLAVAASALATLPATVLRGPLARAGLAAAAFNGSIWSGSAAALTWQSAPLGDAEWTLRPLRLLGGHVAGDLRLTRTDGSVATRFDVSLLSQSVQLDGLSLALPIEALDAMPLGMPKGWRGRITGVFDEVRIDQRWPATLRGTLDLDGLIAPPPRNSPVGSFRAVLPHPSPTASLSVAQDPGNVTAQVRDKEGPFAVDGTLTVSRSRNFALEGTLAPRGPVAPAMERSLQLLGPADAAGRRQFSIGGTL